MPFTVSHVAAILPLRGRPFVPSALAVGAMVPDVPLFVPISSREETHVLSAVFTWNLGLGLLLLAGFHLLLKRPLLRLAPRAVRERLAVPAAALTWRRAWLTVPSLLIGQATHLIWDGFTHWTGPFVELWPVLREFAGPLPWYRWGQYGSGVFGGLAVAVFVLLWLRRAPRVPEPGLSRATVAAVLVASAAAGAVGAVLGVERLPDTLYHDVSHAITGAIAAVGACLTAFAALYWLAVGFRATTGRPAQSAS
ncbi:uncharacterized protein DUF4184 [Actinocorallia herbida]|uniref:Uncharacterized protein DUF4184 n=1 Tax=Actinocorallia herbida TaxID=58109 RepID=A0A3N1D856_9ACTN|nr:DUF4184 family protein [Actinocorallia herbida]ROO89712.1 uncharacterized protein DUF4184 [Actinocorallia herbida]